MNVQELIEMNKSIQKRFKLAKQGHQYDFEKDIKPFVSEVDAYLLSFKKNYHSMLTFPYFNEQKFYRLIQIIEEVSVECHYKRTSTKIFNDKIKVVTHDLNYLKQMSEQNHV